MKTLDEVIAYFDNQTQQRHVYLTEDAEDIYNDALHYLKEYRVVTDSCHKHGIASVWGQVLPDPEKTDWDKKLNFDNAYDNEPLTWSELKQMEGKPVWVENQFYKRWLIAYKVNREDIIFDGNGFYTQAFSVDYCKTWQAYRKERE